MSSLRRYLLLLLALVGAGGLTVASAASLGDVTSDDLGANVALVATCDNNGVTAAFTTAYFPDTPQGYYEVTDVVVSGIAAACNTQDIYVAVTGAGSVELGSGSAVIAGTSVSVPITPVGAAVDARDVTGVSIVITGLP